MSGILFLTAGCSSNSAEMETPEEASIKEEVSEMVNEYVTDMQTSLQEKTPSELTEEDLIAIASEAVYGEMNEEEITQLAEEVGCEPDLLMQYVTEMGGTTAISSKDTEKTSEETQQIQAFSLNEMLSLSKTTQDTIFALKKEELYYPLIGKPNLVKSNGLIVRDTNEPDRLFFKYEEGDSIVAFSSDSTIGVFQELMITDDSEHYCLPFCFQENADGTISTHMGIDDTITDSYVSGNKLMSTFEEYEGTRVYEDTSNKTVSITFDFVLEGNKDEVLELGGYNGTVFETVQYECNARYYTTSYPVMDGEEVVTLGSDSYANTKEGYAIVTDAETNRLEKGLYLIENVMVEVSD